MFFVINKVFGGNPDKLPVLLSEARRMGIKLLPPDVNRSEEYMIPVAPSDDAPRGALLFGLSDVRGVGSKVAKRILQERTANGPFKDPYNFAFRLRGQSHSGVNASLAKVGALSSLRLAERERADGKVDPARFVTRKAMASAAPKRAIDDIDLPALRCRRAQLMSFLVRR